MSVRSSPDPAKIGFSPDDVRSSPDSCSSLSGMVCVRVKVIQSGESDASM